MRFHCSVCKCCVVGAQQHGHGSQGVHRGDGCPGAVLETRGLSTFDFLFIQHAFNYLLHVGF